MSMKRMKHLLVLCLALVMVVGLLSVTALAADTRTVQLYLHVNGKAPVVVTLGQYEVGAEIQPIIDSVDLSNYNDNIGSSNYTAGDPYKDGGGAFADNATITGWTNIHYDITTKEKVVYFLTEEDRVSGSPSLLSTTALYGSTLPTSDAPTPTREGYTFLYWAREGQKTDVTNQTVSGWTNLYGVWEATPKPVSYTVTFNSNGGSKVDSQNVRSGELAEKPADPTRSGYTFLGWYTADNRAFDFGTPITSDITLYAKWEKGAMPEPDLHYYVDANFPSRLLIDTNRDVSISIWGDRGVSWQEDATLYVKVDGPARSDADLWYYDSDGWYWGYGKYVDTVHAGKIPDALEFNETGVTIPLSLYLDRAGTYDFTFTLEAADGTVLATDTATVRAYTETHDDYRIYLDCGRHGSISTSPSTWADYKDTVTIYVNPDKGYELDTLRVYDKDKDRVSIYTNHRGDYTFTMPKSSVTVYATFKEVNYDHFVDVSRDSWYYDAVYYVYDHDIMDGVGNRKFDPYGDLSRAMIVTTLYRMEDEPRVRNYGTFRDVDEDAWYAEAVEWAAEEGIVKGYGKKTFGPNRSVTVEQLAAILQRYADYKGYDIDETIRLYSDAVVSQWAVDNVRWAVAEGLLRGGRSVDSTQVATRAEIAYALYNFMMNVAD